MSHLRSEQLIDAWRERYAAGRCEVEEFEAGVRRALDGTATDAEWVEMAHELRMAARSPRPQSLESVDALLKAAYMGPIGS